MKGNFQIITIIVFIGLGIIGILVFSGAIPLGKNNKPGSLGTVVVWGTAGGIAMAPIFEEFNQANSSFVVKYEQKSADTFDKDLLEALARGRGPDVVFLPDNLAFTYADKIVTIPYESYPLATFKNSFAGAGEVFLTSAGMLAFPIAIDPLVMYYNRAHLDARGIVYPPAFWDDLVILSPELTQKDDSNRIIKSSVALGHFANVAHAKEILSALFMQAGNKIVAEKDGFFNSVLNAKAGDPKYDLASILKFYTDFADPENEAYSWNRSFPNSSEAFSRENVTFYFGYASELVPLINKNPNQNLGVAPLPQIRNSNTKITGARVTGIALLSSSRNFETAFTAANLLAAGNFASKFATVMGVAPARRNLLSNKPANDAYSPIFYDSALYGKSWLDPSPANTYNIFRRMVESVLSNSMTPGVAISDASGKLDLQLRR